MAIQIKKLYEYEQSSTGGSADRYAFDAEDADVILVSAEEEDGEDTVSGSSTGIKKEYRVHRCILATSSPFFKSLFDLPQPISSDSSPTKLPVIPMYESSTVLHALLLFIYPTPNPTISTLDELSHILGAAVKYDLICVISALRRTLIESRFVEHEPTRVYAIATRFQFEEEAKVASRYTLDVDLLEGGSLPEELKWITAWDYQRLLELQRRRAREARMILLKEIALPESVKCMMCNGTAYMHPRAGAQSGFGSPSAVSSSSLSASAFLHPKWWTEFQRRASEELAHRPTTKVIFEMGFLREVVRGCGCLRCAESALDAHDFLEEIKRRIDELPDTI